MIYFEEISNYLKAIADPTRLKIINMLNRHKNPLCVNAIAKKLNVTQSAISQHLRILKQVGLVEGNRQGYHIHYELKFEKFRYFKNKLEGIIAPLNENEKEGCNDNCN